MLFKRQNDQTLDRLSLLIGPETEFALETDVNERILLKSRNYRECKLLSNRYSAN